METDKAQKISYKMWKTLQMHLRLPFTSFKGFPPYQPIHSSTSAASFAIHRLVGA